MTERLPIRSEAEYDLALGEIRRLWGSATGTPDGYALGLLKDWVIAYEKEHYQIPGLPPGHPP